MNLDWGYYVSQDQEPAGPEDAIEVFLALTPQESARLIAKSADEIERRMGYVLRSAQTALVDYLDYIPPRSTKVKLVRAARRFQPSVVPDGPDAWLADWGKDC